MNYRQKTQTTVKIRSELDSSFPCIKQINSMNPCLVMKNPKILSKKRIDANFCGLQNLPESKNSTMCESIRQVSDSSFSDRKKKFLEEVFEKLQKSLADLKDAGFKAQSKVYLRAYNELASSDLLLGRLLLDLKNGLIVGIKDYYKGKISDLRQELMRKNSLVTNIRAEKDVIIAKLNTLSSENINLINSCEDLIQKNAKLEKILKNDSNEGKTRLELVQELLTKTEKIKELRFSIQEMNCHENKLLQIIEKINQEGVDVKKLYSQTPVRHGLFEIKKKKKNPVPYIDLRILSTN